MKYGTLIMWSSIAGFTAPAFFAGITQLLNDIEIPNAISTALISITIIFSPVSLPLGMTLANGTSDVWATLSIFLAVMIANAALYLAVASYAWFALK